MGSAVCWLGLLFVLCVASSSTISRVPDFTGVSLDEFPDDLAPYFQASENNNEVRVLHERILLPKRTGKFIMKLPRTKAYETAFYGDFRTSVPIRADLSVDGRLTSSFGSFGYELRYIFEAQKHQLVLFILKSNEVRTFYTENPYAAEDEYPYLEMYIEYSEDPNDVEEVEEFLSTLESSTISADLE